MAQRRQRWLVSSAPLILLFFWLAFLAAPTPSVNASFPPRLSTTAPITPTLYLPLIQRPAPRLLIAAAHIDSAISGEGDEALWLWNDGPGEIGRAHV